jgi:predicted HD superfamily hydrolase involved in NAD metabolism
MKYNDNQIENLRFEVGKRLSEKRFVHTLGVEKMAVLIGEKTIPEAISELRVAALLHDISKEYSEAEQIFIMKKHNIELGLFEINEPALWHSITAPAVIKDYFPEYATDDVLSSAYNHTVGSPDMSIFDEIILLSDYIEEGRRYEKCISLREEFLSILRETKTTEEAIISLHRAVAKSLDNNIKEFISRGKSYHKRTELTRDAILSKIERLNNG